MSCLVLVCCWSSFNRLSLLTCKSLLWLSLQLFIPHTLVLTHVWPRWSPPRQRKHSFKRFAVFHLSWTGKSLNLSQRQTSWCSLHTLQGRYFWISDSWAFPKNAFSLRLRLESTFLFDEVTPRMVSDATVWNSASCNTNSLRVSTDSQRWFSNIQRWYWASIPSFNFLHKLMYNVPFPSSSWRLASLRFTTVTSNKSANCSMSPAFPGRRDLIFSNSRDAMLIFAFLRRICGLVELLLLRSRGWMS